MAVRINVRGKARPQRIGRSGKTRFYGDWGRLDKWLVRMKAEETFQIVFAKELKEFGDAVVRRVKEHMRRNDLGWPPLSPLTIMRKGFATIYLETKTYYDSIEARIRKTGKYTIELLVGVKGREPRSGADLTSVAFLLEYGTTRIPARPLWRPTYAEAPEMPEFKALVASGVRLGFGSV